MKVVHVLKRIETIDSDIKELRKLEKTLTREKSFTTPIFMTIEKQINIMLDERIKLLNLKIENPPEALVAMVEGEEREELPQPLHTAQEKKPAKKAAPKETKEARAHKKPEPRKPIVIPDDDDIPMLTQDQIDARFNAMKEDAAKSAPAAEKHDAAKKTAREADEDESFTESAPDDTSVKLLDVALEKGTLNKKVIDREKKVRFFRENFPAD